MNVDNLLTNTYIIPTLHNAEQCKAMLHRVVREFAPIIVQRKYDIKSISEMCCCYDGLEYKNNQSIGPVITNNNNNNSNSNRRKPPNQINNNYIKKNGNNKKKNSTTKKRNQNLWGYNRFIFIGNGQRRNHEIHIRLRGFNNHNDMLDYDDVAGTLAHELAHCEVSDHNTKFYTVMNSIIDQHASLVSSNLTITTNAGTRQPLIPFTGTGYTLQQHNPNTSTTNTTNTNQQQELGPVIKMITPFTGTGTKLGGDNIFTQFMTPKEAAVAAADARRRQQLIRTRIQIQIQQQQTNQRASGGAAINSGCCGPMTITIDDDDDDYDTEDDDDDHHDQDNEKNQFNNLVNQIFCQPCDESTNDNSRTFQHNYTNRQNKRSLTNSDDDDDDDDIIIVLHDGSATVQSKDNGTSTKMQLSMSNPKSTTSTTKTSSIIASNKAEPAQSSSSPSSSSCIDLTTEENDDSVIGNNNRSKRLARIISFSCQVCTYLNTIPSPIDYTCNTATTSITSTDVANYTTTKLPQIVQCEMCDSENVLC